MNGLSPLNYLLAEEAFGPKGSGGGEGGVVPNIQATAETLPAGSEATVIRTGSNVNPLFHFGIPEGKQGETGPTGAPGAPGPQGPAGSGSDITPGDGLSKEGDTLNVDNPVRGIMTQAEFDALPEVQKASGTYFVDDGQGGGSGGEVYDDQERVIGTWFGKPLYRKVVAFTSKSSNGWNDITVPRIEEVVRAYGKIKRNDSTNPIAYIAFPTGLASYDYVMIQFGIGYVAFDIHCSYLLNSPGLIVYEYTKTTDTEVSA